MRASHIALILAVLAIPSVGYAQQDNGSVGGPVGGPVGGMVGPEGSRSPEQPRPSLGSPYGSPTRAGPVTGSSGTIAPRPRETWSVRATPNDGSVTVPTTVSHVLCGPCPAGMVWPTCTPS